MFEQSILATQPGKRSWTLAVSLVAQAGLILIGALIPLIYTDQLPGLTKWAQNLVAPSSPPAALPVTVKPAVIRPASKTAPVFTVPAKIPSTIAKGDDLSQRTPDIGAIGVVGAVGAPGVAGDIAQLLGNVMPVPKPPEPPRPAAQPTAAHAPITVSGGVQEAKLLRKIVPLYPPLAIATRTQGTVHLVGVISKDGSIRELKVIDGPPLLVRAAVDAVKQWIYKPTLLSGDPVEVVAPIAVTFTLGH